VENLIEWILQEKKLRITCKYLGIFTLMGIVLPFPRAMFRIAVGCIFNWKSSDRPDNKLGLRRFGRRIVLVRLSMSGRGEEGR
jgi:hypothetical protein